MGLLASSFESLGGVAKLTGGALVDRLNGGTTLVSALVAAAAVHVALAALGAGGSARSLAGLWAVNGLAQAFAWPALAKVFLEVFPVPATRGAWYALLATCQNAGAAAAPHLLAAVVYGRPAAEGWRAAVLLPGALLVAAAAAVAALSCSTKRTSPSTAASMAAQSPAAQLHSTPVLSLFQTVRLVLSSRSAWLLGANYLFNTGLRNGLTEVPAWLLGGAGLRLAPHALALAVGAYELGAAGGGLAAGWLSDRVFAGRRGPPIVLMSLAAAPLPLLLLTLGGADTGDAKGESARATAVAATYFALGFCAFGPHVLNGLAARELAPHGVQATAGGFSKALGQLGGTLAGYPLGILLDRLGWHAVAVALSAAGLAAGLCALPLWDAREVAVSAPVKTRRQRAKAA